MKQIIFIFFLFLLSMVSVNASTEVDLTIVSENAVNTDLHCFATSCTYNIDGSPETDTEVNYFEVADSNAGGSAIGEFLEIAEERIFRYMFGDGEVGNTVERFFKIIETISVSRFEFNQEMRNIRYLADKIDVLEARVYIQEAKHGGFTPQDLEDIKCKTAILKSIRLDEPVTHEGYMADVETFGQTCLTIG